MRLLFTICLLVVVSGTSWIGWAEDTAAEAAAPAAAGTPAGETTSARAEALAIPPTLAERRFWSLRLDAVIFTPLSDALPIVLDDPDNDGTAEGRLWTSTFNQDNEFRPALQYNCTDGNTLFEINYLRLRQTNDIGFAPKAGGAFYWTPLVSPNFGTDFALSADTRMKLVFIELNLNMKHVIRRQESMLYYVDFGFRWAQIDQQFSGRFFNMGGGATTDTVTIQSVISAAGLTFGGGMEYEIFSGLDLTGRVGAFLLQGSLSGSYSDINTGGTQSVAGSSQTALIPGLEAAVFLNYNPDLQLPYAGYILVRAGYEMKNYFQVISTTTFVDDVHDGLLLTNRSSFGLTGYVAGVQFVWPVK